MSLTSIQAFIIDMDGVLYEGARPLPGLVEFFDTLRAKKIRFILATNNASLTPEQYISKLAGMGVTITRDEILSSALAAASWMRKRSPSGARVFAIGEDGVRNALTENGFTLLDLYENHADYVICGMDRKLSWDKLATATINIRAGAKFIGTNPDTTLPTERGTTHGNGAILAALQAASGVQPIIIGKPEPTMYQIAIDMLGIAHEHIAAIGDRLETDILGAERTGIQSILVLSGISTREDIETSGIHPTWVMRDIADITAQLQSK
jgi:4-nitrophenyl phosphatase